MRALKVPKNKANYIRLILLDEEFLSLKWKIKSSEDHVYLPLEKVPDEQLLTKIGLSKSSLVEDEFEKIISAPRSMEELLQDLIPSSKLDDLKKSFDIIGDVVILEIPPELEEDKMIIGKAALDFTKRRSVYLKKSKIKGVTRVRELEHLAGEDNPVTIHKEFGSSLKLNVKKMYFSPRLATERKLIANQVKVGELILDMFCGVGPYAILIARENDVHIWAVDINRDAINYLKENIILNKVQKKIIPVRGDVQNILKNCDIKFDRIIMNLPETALNFLPLAINQLKNGGMVHYYEFSRSLDQSVENVRKAANPFSVKILGKRIVKSRSPGVWQVGVDARIIK
jgi:tRNA (guanine37-N1)-methyltransferase